jgi:hypothetical protein
VEFALADAVTKMRVLRLSGYRCHVKDGSGAFCGEPAALVAHPAPPPALEPMISVCREHAGLIDAEVS